MMYHDFTEAVLVELMEASGWVLWYYDSIITCTCMSNYHLVYIMKSLNFFLGHFSWIVNLSELFTYNGNWYIITLLCMVRVNWTLAWKIRSCQSDVERLTCQHALVLIDYCYREQKSLPEEVWDGGRDSRPIRGERVAASCTVCGQKGGSPTGTAVHDEPIV